MQQMFPDPPLKGKDSIIHYFELWGKINFVAYCCCYLNMKNVSLMTLEGNNYILLKTILSTEEAKGDL